MHVYYELTATASDDLGKDGHHRIDDFDCAVNSLAEDYDMTKQFGTFVELEIIYKSDNYVILGDKLRSSVYFIFRRTASKRPFARFDDPTDALSYVRMLEKRLRSISPVYQRVTNNYSREIEEHRVRHRTSLHL